MADDFVINVTSNKAEISNELDKKIEEALYRIGLLGVESCVEKASEIDSVTGRPTVDTGRYRAGFGFITSKRGKMNGTKSIASESSDNFTQQRAPQDTVIIANNVEYAPYLEYGSGTQEGGHHARYIMKRGIESKIPEITETLKKVLKGDGVNVTITKIGGNE